MTRVRCGGGCQREAGGCRQGQVVWRAVTVGHQQELRCPGYIAYYGEAQHSGSTGYVALFQGSVAVPLGGRAATPAEAH